MSRADIRRGDRQWERTSERIQNMQRYANLDNVRISPFATDPARNSDVENLDLPVRWTKKP